MASEGVRKPDSWAHSHLCSGQPERWECHSHSVTCILSHPSPDPAGSQACHEDRVKQIHSSSQDHTTFLEGLAWEAPFLPIIKVVFVFKVN